MKRRFILAVPLFALCVLQGTAGEGRMIKGTSNSLPRMVTSYGTYGLGKKPYPEGTRKRWIAEGRVQARAPKSSRIGKAAPLGYADNRQYLPPVASQGSEGSCVHWAGTYYAKTANMKRLDPSLDVTRRQNQCSPRFTYNLSNGGADVGNFGHEPFELFMRYGVPSWAQLPYVAGQYAFLPDMEDFVEGLHRRTEDYVWLWEWGSTPEAVNELKTFLDVGGVAVAALNSDGFSSWDAGDPPWVGDTGNYYDVNHMVAVCGYGPGYYLIVNSWGRYFGSNGFITVDADYFENYFADVFYPVEGTYEPVTHHAEFQIEHPQRSDIKSVSISVNDTVVWSNALPPRSVPKEDIYYKRDTRENWSAAVDISTGPWTGDAVVRAEFRDPLYNNVGTLTDFRVVQEGQDYVSLDTPVEIPDANQGAAVVTVTMEGGVPPPLHEQINCGGSSVEDWEADRDYSTVSGGARSVWNTITGTDDVSQSVYKSRRYGQQVAYDLDVPDGTYTIRLHFAELWSSTIGLRRFNVSLEDAEVLSNFDIALESGGSFRALTRTFERVSVSGGLQIVADAISGTAQFNGIEVISAGPPSPSIEVSSPDVSVPEGGNATFGVRLNTEPEGSVTVTVGKSSGDEDLVVTDGESLTFNAGNYDEEQLVTIAAGEDVDSESGCAVIQLIADGWTAAEVTATEQDNDTPPLHEQINCGGSAVEEWEADRDYTTVSGGARSVWYSITGAGDVPQSVYKSRRYGSQVAYDLDVPDGTYTIRLHFAELYSASIGIRRFDVSIEGNEVLSAFDIAAESGGKYLSVTRTFESVSVSGGLQIVADAISGTAQFNGIEVISAGPPSPSIEVSSPDVSVPEGGNATFGVRLNTEPEGSVTVTVTQSSGDEDLTVTRGASLTFNAGNYDEEQLVTIAAAEDVDSESGSAVFQLVAEGWSAAEVTTTEQDNDTPPLHEKISCGGSAVEEWEAERDGTSVSGGVNQYFYTIANLGDVPQAVYQSRRHGLQVAYDLDLPDGTYNIRLHFAELWTSSTGVRVFNVDVEGNEVLSRFDIVREAGGKNRAHAETFENVTVSGGLQIEGTALSGTAQFNGIEVWLAGPPPPAVEASVSTVSVPEGGSATFGVKLNTEPEGFVTVAVTQSSGDEDLTVTRGASLTFNAANYDEEQLVTVSAAEDVDSASGSAVITCTATGYASVEVTAGEQDNDTPPLHEKISCGGSTVEEWEADRDYATVSGGARSVWYSIANAGEVPQSVYKTRRYGQMVTYDLDVPDGTYTIRLHFAELYSATIGLRRFNVSIEGTEVLSAFDIARESGGKFTAVTRTFEGVSVSDGLQIVAEAISGTAQFNGIEIWSSSAGAAQPVRLKQSSASHSVVSRIPAVWVRSGNLEWEAAPELMDGNPATVWTGSPHAAEWAIAIDFGAVIPLESLELFYDAVPWDQVAVMGSANMEEWVDLNEIDDPSIDCRALYLVFMDDRSDSTPAVSEIHWKEAGPPDL
jgi:Malectin domain/Papain family cysteine protease